MLSNHCAGLLLYAADLVLRAGQLANVTAVAAAKVDERSDIVTLQLKADAVSEGPEKAILSRIKKKLFEMQKNS